MNNTSHSYLFFVCLLSLIFPSLAFAYGHGISSYPLGESKLLLTTEFVGHTSSGSKGVGIQARASRRMNELVIVDLGVGVADNDRANRFFVATDIEFIPDYDNQPRIALRASFESAEEFNNRNNILGISPVVSKGYSVWEIPMYPFLALPLGLTLNTDNKKYELRSALSAGFTTPMPIKEFEHLLINTELNVNLNNSFTGVFVGLSYPLN